MEQAVALIHRTKEAAAAEQAALFDQFLRHIRGVNAAPGFFEELLPLITEELMGEEDTRHFVPQFIEEACRREKAMIPMCTAAISELSKDEKPEVLSKVMRATGVLFRKSLIAICADDGDVAEEDQADMWQAVREAAQTLRKHSKHQVPHVANSAVMLLQVLANVLSAPQDADGGDGEEEEGGQESFSLHSIPPCHQFLDYSQLKKFGQECLEELLALLHPSSSTPWHTMSVAMHCLGRVARHNPHLIGTIEPVLTSICSSSVSKEMRLLKWETASMRSTVKSTLLALLKQPRCAAYAAVLVERLTALGAVTQAEAARRIMEKARWQYQRGGGNKRPSSKRHLDPRVAQADSAKRSRLADAPIIDLKRIPAGKGPEEWQGDLVSEVILAAMKNYPPALPPHLIDVADTPLSMWPQRLAHPGVYGTKGVGMEVGDKAEEGEAADTSQTAVAIRNKALIKSKPLQKPLVKALADDALLRLLEGEAGGWSARTRVVASLVATSEAAEIQLEATFVKHILENFADRQSLGVEYLHQVLIHHSILKARSEGGAKEEATKEVPERYAKVLNLFVEAIINPPSPIPEPDTQRLLTKLLADVPAIDQATMHAVSRLCDDEKKEVRQIGMSCLRALIQHHQAWRSEALGRLLKYTVAPDESMRSPAIRLVANKLFRLTYLSNHVESFAVANLRKACLLSPLVLQQSTAEGDESSGAGKETGGQQVLEEGGQQVMRHYMHLFMALCAQKHDLLHALIDSYVQATPPVRSAVQASITDMIKAIGPESAVLLGIIDALPKGAELLVLAFVRTLTDSASAAQQKKLLDAIKRLYASNKDARFMIYICSSLSRSEVEELLPRLVALQQVGVKAALHRLLHSRTSALTPEKLMVALHKLQPQGKDLTMKKIVEAIEMCFNHRPVFTTQVLAVVLQRLLDQNPLPELYMRTVLLALKASPTLTDFVMGILQRLISKQVWTMATLWKGFVKCCRQTLPRSVAVLVQLPPQQLSKAVQECGELGQPLALYLKDQMASGYSVLPAHLKIVEPWLRTGGKAAPSGKHDSESEGEQERDG